VKGQTPPPPPLYRPGTPGEKMTAKRMISQDCPVRGGWGVTGAIFSSPIGRMGRSQPGYLLASYWPTVPSALGLNWAGERCAPPSPTAWIHLPGLEVGGGTREGGGCQGPPGLGGGGRGARAPNERNTGQSSANPRHCDTELLRVRKIRV
jgi:hypothetical protein